MFCSQKTQANECPQQTESGRAKDLTGELLQPSTRKDHRTRCVRHISETSQGHLQLCILVEVVLFRRHFSKSGAAPKGEALGRGGNHPPNLKGIYTLKLPIETSPLA